MAQLLQAGHFFVQVVGPRVAAIDSMGEKQPGFLEGLKDAAKAAGALLIFDEVVTGFRLAYGGAQEYFGVKPDLASYGKIVGGGGPVGCVAGSDAIMEQCNPVNRGKANYAYINGTLHGNPIGCVAGLATLAELRKPDFYDRLQARAAAPGKDVEVLPELQRADQGQVLHGEPAGQQALLLRARLQPVQDLHDALLNEALNADPVEPGLTLINTIAQEQAAELLEDGKDYF